MTKERKGVLRRREISFSNKNQLITALSKWASVVHALVKVRIDGEIVQTTPGRLIF